MKSRTSFFNKGLIFSNLKRYSWTSILWTILLFLSVPLALMNESAPTLNQDHYHYLLFSFGAIWSSLMLCVFPVLIGVLTFRYLHSQKSSTMLHGLPFSRPRLFVSSVLSGLLLMIVPFIINGVISFIIMFTMPIGHYMTYDIITTWLVNSLCVGFIMFSLTVLVGMFTGNLIAHGVFTYIIHFLPIILWITIVELLHNLVLGFPYHGPHEFLLAFPLIRVFDNSSPYNIYYAVFALIFLALAFALYRKRPAESAGDIVSFKFVRPIFKYGVTFCTSIVGYIFFTSVFENFGGIVLFMVFALIGYCLAQMLLSKTWRIWVYWKGFAVSALIIAVFWVGIKTDITGYERYVPSADTVASVSFTPPVRTSGYTLETTNPEAISIICSIHEKIISNPKYHTVSPSLIFSSQNDWINLTYKAKNSVSISRSYTYDKEAFAEEFSMLYQIPDIKEKLFPFVYDDNENVERIEAQLIGSFSANLSITSKEDIKALKEAYKKDIEASTEDFYKKYYSADSVGFMYIYIPSDDGALEINTGESTIKYETYHYNIQNTYTNTITLLKSLEEKTSAEDTKQF